MECPEHLVSCTIMLILSGCYGQGGWSASVPSADAAAFQSVAYPVLMRDCAFSECHGAPARFFRVLGPGRTRLDPETSTDEPPTAAEIQLSYERSLSMLTTLGEDSVRASLLLLKPLEASAGGIGHHGVDAFGRNVYASRQSEGYKALEAWAMGKQATAAVSSSGAIMSSSVQP